MDTPKDFVFANWREAAANAKNLLDQGHIFFRELSGTRPAY